MASQTLVRREKIVETFGVKRRRLESLKRQQAQPTFVDLVRVDVGAGCGTGFQPVYFTG